MARSVKVSKQFHFAIIGLLLLALGLSACSGSPTPPPPTNTPANRFFKDTDPQRYFSIEVLAGWNKTTIDVKSVAYLAPLPDTKITVATDTFNRLQPQDRTLLDRRIDQIRNQYRQLTTNPSGQITTSEGTATLYEIKYNNAKDVVEYVAQVNVVGASRAYLLQGLTSLTEADKNKEIFLRSFNSMTFNPPNTSVAVATANTNPTVLSSQEGGVVQARQGFPADNSIARVPLANWTTPPLNTNLLALNGFFPATWQWRLVKFPKPENSGIIFSATNTSVVSGSSAEATIQIGLIENAFASEAAPSLPDFEKIATPYLEYYNAKALTAIGVGVTIFPFGTPSIPVTTPTAVPTGTPPPTPRVSPTAPISSAGVQRAPFVVRNSDGKIVTKGAIYARQLGKNLIISSLLLSSGAALVDSTVNDYEAVMLKLMGSLKLDTSKPVN